MLLRKIYAKNLLPRQFIRVAKFNMHTTSEDKETHFGFQSIKETDKSKEVFKVFEKVAGSYDLMNDAMSMGIHRIWKDVFMCRLSPTDGTKLLDMAGGTGDIAFRFLNYVNNHNLNECHVTISDINPNMLEVGKIRSRSLKHDSKMVDWKIEDAENLTFADNSFNAYTIAMGIRNCTRIDRVLSEAYRVLEPGGRFLCLELSPVDNEVLRWFYDQYSFQMIPVMGQIIAGEWQPYQYLVESIRRFPTKEEFRTMIEEAGFRQTTYESLSLGIVAIHSGFKL